jgi:hypothetical protein
MKSNELKETVISYAKNTSIKECVELFKGIVSQDTIYKWLRDTKVLKYAYTLDQCKQELERYKHREPLYSNAISSNRLVHTFQPHFFDKENKLWQKKDIQKKLILNRKKYLNKDTTLTDRELLRGFKISGIHIGYSHFSPLWFKRYILDENIKSVYDPCGGWGHRLIGAYLSNIDYVYNDLWNKSYTGCKEISNFIGYNHCTLYNNDCTTFTPSDNYDCVFTCPPYYNVESYDEKTFKNLDDYNQFLTKMFKSSIKESVTKVGIVINNTYKQNIIESIDTRFILKDRILLGTTDKISHFNKGNSVKQEILLKFEL